MDCLAQSATSGDCTMDCSATQALTFAQITKLDEVLKQAVEINSRRSSFPALMVTPVQMVKTIKKKLISDNIAVHDIRLNGSAASYCIADDKQTIVNYKDLDLIFHVTIKGERDFHFIREHVLQSLLDFFPEGFSKDQISTCALEDCYVHKQVKVNTGYRSGDRWSLISLHSGSSCGLDFKFVDRMNRQYRFSTDSFQIFLDSYFQLEGLDCIQDGTVELKSTFFPTVQAFSAYGDYAEAEYHLNNRLIRTKNPEEIRGGGLFKYCNLLTAQYKPYNSDEMDTQERTMCTRFFIDFQDPSRQSSELQKYFNSHYSDCEVTEGVYFLNYLLSVIRKSSVQVLDNSVRSNFENMVIALRTIHLYRNGIITFVPTTSYRTHARKNSSGGYLQSPTTSQSNGASYSYGVPARVSTPPGSYVTPVSPFIITSAAVASNSNGGNA